MTRATQADVYSAMRRFASEVGIDFRASYAMESAVDEDGNRIMVATTKQPYLMLDHGYGGWMIVQIDPQISLTGHFTPFGHVRRTPSKFVEYVNAMTTAVQFANDHNLPKFGRK